MMRGWLGDAFSLSAGIAAVFATFILVSGRSRPCTALVEIPERGNGGGNSLSDDGKIVAEVTARREPMSQAEASMSFEVKLGPLVLDCEPEVFAGNDAHKDYYDKCKAAPREACTGADHTATGYMFSATGATLQRGAQGELRVRSGGSTGGTGTAAFRLEARARPRASLYVALGSLWCCVAVALQAVVARRRRNRVLTRSRLGCVEGEGRVRDDENGLVYPCATSDFPEGTEVLFQSPDPVGYRDAWPVSVTGAVQFRGALRSLTRRIWIASAVALVGAAIVTVLAR